VLLFRIVFERESLAVVQWHRYEISEGLLDFSDFWSQLFNLQRVFFSCFIFGVRYLHVHILFTGHSFHTKDIGHNVQFVDFDGRFLHARCRIVDFQIFCESI